MKDSQFKSHQWARARWAFWDPHEAPDNLQVGHVECVSLTISDPLFLLSISKVLSMKWGDFTVKNVT